MLIRESSLCKSNILNELDQSIYLTQEESMLHLEEVPVIVKESGTNLVDYEYLDKLSEENGCTIFEAASLIQESNNLDSLIISIDEGDAIAESDIFDPSCMVVRPINEDGFIYNLIAEACECLLEESIDEDYFFHIVLDEVSQEDLDKYEAMASRHKTRYLDQHMADRADAMEKWKQGGSDKAYLQTRDKSADTAWKKMRRANQAVQRLARIKDAKDARQAEEAKQAHTKLANLEGNREDPKKEENPKSVLAVKQEPTTTKPEEPKPVNTTSATEPSLLQKHSKAIGVAAGVGAAALAGIAAYKQYKNKPKSVIGKKIAALRSVYSKFMNRAKSSNDPGITAKLKKMAAKILSVIDKLMGYLQNKAG